MPEDLGELQEHIQWIDDVIYLPCTVCDSVHYDFANGEVDEAGRYQPNGCDLCGFGNIKKSNMLLH